MAENRPISPLVECRLAVNTVTATLVTLLLSCGVYANTNNFERQLQHAEPIAVPALAPYQPNTADLKRWQDNVAVSIAYETTPQFADREVSDADLQVREQLEIACTAGRSMDCLSHIKQNRSELLTALPANPRFWDNFWALISTDLVLDELFREKGDGPSIFNAALWWYARDLAEDGKIDLTYLIQSQRSLRLASMKHRTAIGSMTNVALRGITSNYVSLALAQAAVQSDRQGIIDLEEHLQPLSPQALSWGYVLAMEWIYLSQRLKKFEESDNSDPSEIPKTLKVFVGDKLLSLEEEHLEQAIENPMQFIANQYSTISAYYIPYTEVPSDIFWQQGLPNPEQVELKNPTVSLSHLPNYNLYIVLERTSNLTHHLFGALQDIYTGRSSPGIPSRTAPNFWKWAWEPANPDQELPQLCLVSDQVHPSIRRSLHNLGHNTPARTCLDYYEESAAMMLVAG